MTPNEQFFEFIRESITSHDRQLGEITDDIAKLKSEMTELKDTVANLTHTVSDLTVSVAATTMAVDRVSGLLGPMLSAMKTLAETVTGHERRITDLESPA